MELEHSFTVPVPKSRAWDVLLDVERVAPCMPGATLDSVDGDEIHGRIKVKVGPINMTYAGTARFIERDQDAGVVTLEASGKETRGAGTASASVHSVLEDRGDETHVKVKTTLNVTGKPAQFGRGVMNEVGGKLLSIFAANLAATIAQDNPAGTGEAEAAAPAGAADSAAAAPPAHSAPGSTSAPSAASAPGSTSTPGGGGNGNGSSAAPADGSATNGSSSVSEAAAHSSGSGTASAGQASSAEGSAQAGPGTPVEELKLPVRATTSLQREGVRTAGQLAAKTEDELLSIDGIGPASLVDIKDKLAELGLGLAGPPASSAPASSGPAAPAASSSPASSSPAPRQAALHEAARQPEDDSLNLLKVAGLPVLKRAAPVLAALAAALVIGLTRRALRRKR